jgi:hypothetical protein
MQFFNQKNYIYAIPNVHQERTRRCSSIPHLIPVVKNTLTDFVDVHVNTNRLMTLGKKEKGKKKNTKLV